jgi:hypothetical protein
MFGLGKITVALSVLADSLAKSPLHLLDRCPVGKALIAQDVIRKQAVQVGVPPKRFIFEVIAITIFATTQAINRERLERRMTAETAEALIKQFILAIHERLHETSTYDLQIIGLGPEEAFDLMMERSERYAQPGWGKGPVTDVRRFFAEFCGFPNSAVLEQVGWTLFLEGDRTGEYLRRKVKIIMPVNRVASGASDVRWSNAANYGPNSDRRSCNWCGKAIHPSARFCSGCGRGLPTR